MKRAIFLPLLCLALAVMAQPRQEIYLEKGWRFTRGDISGAADPAFDDSRWESVEVPHDWAIYGPFDKEIDKQVVAIEQNGETVPTEKTGRTGALPYIGVGWYRTTFAVPSGRRATLVFDGAMSWPIIYVNGKEVGRWAYGYTPFYIDVTSYLKEGDNCLAVRLENLPESSRWYPGAGLYRPVRLVLTGDVAVRTWGTRITTPVVTPDNALVQIDAEIENASGHDLDISTVIYDATGNPVVRSDAQELFFDGTTSARLTIKTPRLWSPESPSLYTAVVSVKENGELLDEYATRFGVRSIEISPEKGFVLNGVPRKFKGVCLHHDLGPLGAAVNKAALRRQLLIMKEMGCDAIRTAHNIPASWQMELCDEMGLMVMAESFDEWAVAKCKNGYNLFFDEWAEKDLVSLIRCNRNHPSIVMWSIGNEVNEQSRTGGGKVAKFLQDICHREDPTRPVTVGMDRPDHAMKNQFAAVLDVPGLNYRLHRYEESYKRMPQRMILGSETASTISSRGVYKFPVEQTKGAMYEDAQCCSYDMGACPWSNLPDDDWAFQDDKSWVIGEFVWTGFDYLGESDWPRIAWNTGLFDRNGNWKHLSWERQSWWTDKPMVHIVRRSKDLQNGYTDDWTPASPDSYRAEVIVYSNCDEVELLLNGKSLGIQSVPHDDSPNIWHIDYQPGVLKAIGRINGNEVANHEHRTAGEAHHIILETERTVLPYDWEEVAYLTATVVDMHGVRCPNILTDIKFNISGPGEIISIDNSDVFSHERYKANHRTAYKGRVIAIVRAIADNGTITVKAEADGLGSSNVTIKATR